MYDNWIKVCNVNKSLKDKLFELADENAELKSASANWKNLLKEKDDKIQEIKVELENTHKNLRMLNFGTSNLEQILNMGQSVCNRNGLGYTGVTNDVVTTSKTVFVKVAAVGSLGIG